jgi:hypothetical protein
MSNPADLNTVPQPDTDKNYFNFKATGLKIDQTYAIKFQWVYSDGTVSDWSPGKFVNTSTESVPSAPTATVTGGAGFIKVELPTFPTNALRVDIRIAGGTFGTGTVVADSFTSAGVKTIAALGAADPGNAYIVTLLTVTPSKINGDPTSATTVYVTDPSAALVVTAPQDPFAPVVKAGLASVIVEWSGKKSDGTDLTVTGFSGAKVHIGTTAGFTPSADNWVHTLNFANGSNRVSIGVGSVIDKTVGTTLQYGTAYHVKLVAVNASGSLSSAVSASNNPVTVARLPASEIDAGILRADAYIQAGADGGQRAVLSGSTSPFIIYGTDGTTKLLEFLTSGTTGTLAIKGSGTFSGDISAASGTFTGNVTTSGNISASNGLFSVNNGLLTAQSGTIGGWTITGSLLESAVVDNNKITLNPATPKIALVQSSVEKITIDPVEGIVGPNITYNGTSVPSFKLTPAGNLTLYGSITVTGGNAATSDQVNAKNKTFVQNDAPTNPISGYSLVAGDLWFDANDNNKQYRWSGSAWDIVQDGTIAAAKAKADTSLQQGGNEIRNASNQVTTINSTGITITGSTFSLNGAGTATTPAANNLVINSNGITAQNSSGQTTFAINASTGNAEFTGTVTGSRVQTFADSYYGSIRMGYTEGFGTGSTLEVVGANGVVSGQLYQFNNGNELILRHGSSREIGGYPTSSAYITLNPFTLAIGFTNSSGALLRGLSLESTAGGSSFTNARFENMAVSSSGANSSGTSVADTGRYFRNTVINNTSPSGSGFAIGDIWIQY